jgi:hypothetical protein
MCLYFIKSTSLPSIYDVDELQHPFSMCQERERDDAARNITDTDRDKNLCHGSMEAVNKITAFCLQLAQSV